MRWGEDELTLRPADAQRVSLQFINAFNDKLRGYLNIIDSLRNRLQEQFKSGRRSCTNMSKGDFRKNCESVESVPVSADSHCCHPELR